MLRKLLVIIFVVNLLFPTHVTHADGPVVLGLGRLTSIALSPDGSRLAVGTAIGVYFYDAQTFAPQGFWDTGNWVGFVRWSPRGDALAVIYDGTNVDLRSTADGRVLWSTTVPWRRAVEFSADGSHVIVSTRGGKANVFDAVTGALIDTVVDELISMPDWYVSISPNRQWQAYSYYWNEGEISLTELAGAASRHYSLRDPQGGRWWKAHVFAWSPDSQTLYSAGSSRIYAWDVATGQQLRKLEGFSGSVSRVTWSADGRSIVSVEGDNLVVSDVASRLPVNSAQPELTPGQILINPDGDVMVMDWYGGAVFYDVTTLTETGRYALGRSGDFAFQPDGQLLAVGGRGPFINIREASTGKARFDLRGSPTTGYVSALAFSLNGETLYTVEDIGQVRQWDLATRTSTVTALTQACIKAERLFDVALNIPSQRIVIERSKDIVVCDLATGDFLYPLAGHSAEASWVNARTIIINHQGTRVAAIVGYPGIIKIWNLETGTLLAEYAHTDEVNDIAFSPNQNLLASGGDDGTIRIWPVP